MGAIWAQEASKPAPGALRDACSTANDPSKGAKKLPRASRDPPELDFDPPRDRLGIDFASQGPQNTSKIAATQCPK